MFPSNGSLNQASPFLPRVLVRRVPPAQRYYGTLRIPPSFPPRLITRDGYRPMRLRSLPWTRRRSRAWSFRVWQPHANCGQRRTDTLKFPGSPSVPLPCSRDPGRTAASGHTTQRRGPRSSDSEGSHDQTAFGAQSHGFSTRCLRFAPRLSPSDARLASAVGQLYGAGLQPAGLLRKVSSTFPTSHSPLPDLLDATPRLPLIMRCMGRCSWKLSCQRFPRQIG